MTPKLSIIIITKNQYPYLSQTIPRLYRQTFKDFEVVVVDSGSTDRSLALYRKYSVKVVPIKPTSFNYAEAFNLGARKAQGKYLLRLSGDAVPQGNNFLQKQLDCFTSRDIAGVCGTYEYTDEMVIEYKIPFLFYQNLPQKKIVRSPFPIAGGCVMIPKKLWQEHPFDTKFTIGEDVEWEFWALKHRYHFVIEPKAAVRHIHTRNKQDLIKLVQYIQMNFLLGINYPVLFIKFIILMAQLTVRYLLKII